jgi:hypothetical protein
MPLFAAVDNRGIMLCADDEVTAKTIGRRRSSGYRKLTRVSTVVRRCSRSCSESVKNGETQVQNILPIPDYMRYKYQADLAYLGEGTGSRNGKLRTSQNNMFVVQATDPNQAWRSYRKSQFGSFPSPPWADLGVKVWKSQAVEQIIGELFEDEVEGCNGASRSDIVKEIQNLGIPVFLIGGFVREIIQSVRCEDIDLTLACNESGIAEIEVLAKHKRWPVTVKGNGTIKIGDIRDKHCLEAAAHAWLDIGCASSGSPWHNSDFGCNSLLYCFATGWVIDRTGTGLVEAGQKLLSVPYTHRHWERWLHRGGRRPFDKCLRWCKFLHRGYAVKECSLSSTRNSSECSIRSLSIDEDLQGEELRQRDFLVHAWIDLCEALLVGTGGGEEVNDVSPKDMSLGVSADMKSSLQASSAGNGPTKIDSKIGSKIDSDLQLRRDMKRQARKERKKLTQKIVDWLVEEEATRPNSTKDFCWLIIQEVDEVGCKDGIDGDIWFGRCMLPLLEPHFPGLGLQLTADGDAGVLPGPRAGAEDIEQGGEEGAEGQGQKGAQEPRRRVLLSLPPPLALGGLPSS